MNCYAGCCFGMTLVNQHSLPGRSFSLSLMPGPLHWLVARCRCWPALHILRRWCRSSVEFRTPHPTHCVERGTVSPGCLGIAISASPANRQQSLVQSSLDHDGPAQSSPGSGGRRGEFFEFFKFFKIIWRHPDLRNHQKPMRIL